MQVKARSVEAAEAIFKATATHDFELKGYSKEVVVNDVDIFSVLDAATYKAKSEGDVLMKAVKYPKYHFIPSDDKLLENEGFCVVDQFVGIYGPKIKKLTRQDTDQTGEGCAEEDQVGGAGG